MAINKSNVSEVLNDTKEINKIDVLIYPKGYKYLLDNWSYWKNTKLFWLDIEIYKKILNNLINIKDLTNIKIDDVMFKTKINNLNELLNNQEFKNLLGFNYNGDRYIADREILNNKFDFFEELKSDYKHYFIYYSDESTHLYENIEKDHSWNENITYSIFKLNKKTLNYLKKFDNFNLFFISLMHFYVDPWKITSDSIRKIFETKEIQNFYKTKWFIDFFSTYMLIYKYKEVYIKLY